MLRFTSLFLFFVTGLFAQDDWHYVEAKRADRETVATNHVVRVVGYDFLSPGASSFLQGIVNALVPLNNGIAVDSNGVAHVYFPTQEAALGFADHNAQIWMNWTHALASAAADFQFRLYPTNTTNTLSLNVVIAAIPLVGCWKLVTPREHELAQNFTQAGLCVVLEDFAYFQHDICLQSFRGELGRLQRMSK